MEESSSGFEHEAGYTNPRTGVTGCGPLPPAACNISCAAPDFGIIEDLDDPTQHVAYQTVDETFYNVMNKRMNAPLPHTGSSYTETEEEHLRSSGQIQSGPQPVSLHHNPNLVDNVTYTKFCGVYSPEKVPPLANSQNADSPYQCPRCRNKFTRSGIVKKHFLRCITKHGNPDALRWNDHSSLQPLRKGERRDEARNNRFYDRLKAYSGVKIPSKLPPGQIIVKYVSSLKRGNHLCAVCGGGPFSVIYHVKSHFISCVQKFGNPTGANWYDRLDGKGIRKPWPGRSDTIANAPPTM